MVNTSRLNKWFESSFESTLRIMSRKFNLKLYIRGNRCCTDGETIWLPMIEDASDEMVTDLVGMGYHEVSHCKYTDFNAMKELYRPMLHNRWLKEFFNAIEDSRIELLLVQDFPGTQVHLDRLNQKWKFKSNQQRFKKNPETGKYIVQWPIRLISAMREVVDNVAPQLDEQTEPFIVKLMPELIALRDIDNSRDLILACEDIRVKMRAIREELFEGKCDMTDEEIEAMLEAIKDMETEIPLGLDPDNDDRKHKKEAVGDEEFDPHAETDFGDEGEEESDEEEAEGGDDSDESEGKGEAKSKDDSDESDSESGSEESDEDGSDESDSDEEGSGSNSEDDSELNDEESDSKSGSSEDDSDEDMDSESDDDSESDMDSEDSEEEDKASISAEQDGDEEADKSDSDTDSEKERIKEDAAEWEDSEEDEKLLEDEDGDESEFDNHVFSAESFIEEKLNEVFDKDDTDSAHYTGKHENADVDESLQGVPFTREFDELIDLSGQGDQAEYIKLKSIVSPVVTPIRLAFERQLMVRQRSKTKYDRERGQLNPRVLSKFTTDRNFRTPFKETIKAMTNDTAVMVLQDCSGSMGWGDKMEVARRASLALGLSLEALQIPFEICGFDLDRSAEMIEAVRNSGLSSDELERFTRKSCKLRMQVFKSFTSKDLSGICLAQAGGSNEDAESVMWAARRLAERPEKRKILMVLSDGQPAGETPDHILIGDLKRVAKLLPKTGIEVIAIGIQTDAPKKFYPNWVEVNNLEMLPSVVVGEISKMLLKGAN